MHIVLFGIQWSGKWTQAARLRQHNSSLAYFAPWDIFRALTSQANALGDYVKEKIAAWQLIKDDIVQWLFSLYTKTLEWRRMLLDGFPRSQDQFDTLHSYLLETGESCVGIVLDLPDHIARERMLARGRPDDTPEAIDKRIAQYYASTQPLLSRFGRYYWLHTIDATMSIDDVFEAIVAII